MQADNAAKVKQSLTSADSGKTTDPAQTTAAVANAAYVDSGEPARWENLGVHMKHERNMHILGLIREDYGWALSRILLAERLEEAVNHVIADSPGTPETVKGYLRKAKRGF